MTGKEWFLNERLYQALQLAIEIHGRDARKSSQVPVLSHLLSVCALVQFDGGDEDEAIAALLHDVLEDRPEKLTREQIVEKFGSHVLDIIKASIDTAEDYQGGPKKTWHERKSAYLEHSRTENPALLRVTVADKIDNARAMLAEYRRVGDRLWDKFNATQSQQKWYYQELVKAYRQAGFTSPLLDDLEELVQKLVALPEANK
jgi:(p)ppGpp synthase/HD superfamily hydrolase